MKFQKCLSDSCLFKNEDDSLWTGIYVDDILLVGNDTIIEETIKKYQVGLISRQRKVWMNMLDVSWNQERMFCLSIRDALLMN